MKQVILKNIARYIKKYILRNMIRHLKLTLKENNWNMSIFTENVQK